MENFTERFEAFLAGATEIRRIYSEKNGYQAFYNPVLTYTEGKKFIRIVEQNMKGENQSVFCFIDKTNGDVLKSAGWKVPAKGARGNIFDEHNGLGRITPYGTEYNR